MNTQTQTTLARIARGTIGRTVNLTYSGKRFGQAASTEKCFGITFHYNAAGKVSVRVIDEPTIEIGQVYMWRGGRSYGGSHRSSRSFPKSKTVVLRATERVGDAWEFSIGKTGVTISAKVENGQLVVSLIAPAQVEKSDFTPDFPRSFPEAANGCRGARWAA